MFTGKRLAVFMLALALLLSFASLSQGATFNLNPTADTYVNGAAPTTNYGTATTVLIKGSTDTNYVREAYFKFDLSGVTGGSVTSAAIGEFLAEPSVDGALVGGASLKVDEMAAIVARAAITARARNAA